MGACTQTGQGHGSNCNRLMKRVKVRGVDLCQQQILIGIGSYQSTLNRNYAMVAYPMFSNGTLFPWYLQPCDDMFRIEKNFENFTLRCTYM